MFLWNEFVLNGCLLIEQLHTHTHTHTPPQTQVQAKPRKCRLLATCNKAKKSISAWAEDCQQAPRMQFVNDFCNFHVGRQNSIYTHAYTCQPTHIHTYNEKILGRWPWESWPAFHHSLADRKLRNLLPSRRGDASLVLISICSTLPSSWGTQKQASVYYTHTLRDFN